MLYEYLFDIGWDGLNKVTIFIKMSAMLLGILFPFFHPHENLINYKTDC